MKKIIISILANCLVLALGAQSFNLDSLKFLTLENNKTIREARLEVKASEQVKKNAITNYFPKVFGGALAMRADDYLLKEEIPAANLPVYDGNPVNLLQPTQFAYFPGMELELFDYLNVGYVAAVEPLYMGGRVRNGNKLAALGTDVSQQQLLLSEEEALLKTEELYWNLASLRGRMNTLNSYEKMLESLHADVEVSYEAGLISKTDLLKVELSQNELLGKKLQLQNGIELMSMMICQHVGIEYTSGIDIVVDEIPGLEPEDYFIDPDTAVRAREEYKMLEMAIEAEKLRKRMAIGENMPQLMVGAQGVYYDMLDQENTAGILFANISIPLSGWWGGAHKIREQQIKIDIAENKLAESSELMSLQINKACKDLTESRSRVAIAESAVARSAEHLKVSSDNYEAGLISTSDLLEAQAMYQEAEDGLTDAKSNYRIRQVQYRRVAAQ